MVPSRIALLGLGLTLSGCTPANSPDKAPEKTSDNTPDVPDCMAKPPWVESTSPDAVPLEIHVENKLVGDYRAKLVCIDIQPYGTTQAPERDDVLNVAGFSDAVFEVIEAFASGKLGPAHWVGEIEKIAL